MDSQQKFLRVSEEAKDMFLPHLSTDPVVFGFDQSELKVLLIQMTYLKQWLLPGGYVKKDEDIDDAAKRVLKERAGVSDVYLEEFGVFGKNKRSEVYFKDFEDSLWHKQRFVTVGYYALYNPDNGKLIVDEFSDKCEWVYLSQLPEIELAMDHREIIEKALLTLRERLTYKPIGYNLLPEKFTMKDLQALYETILGEKFRRNNFQRKILSMNSLERLEKLYDGSANKAPFLYKFIKE